MKATTALANLEKAVERLQNERKVNYKMHKGYELIKCALENKRTIIRPAYYSGRGRFTTIMNHVGDVHLLLNAANIKFYNYNDAPRGSVTGEVYQLTHIEF